MPWPVPDRGNIPGVVQDARHRDPIGLDAVLGDEKPSLEQIAFRTGGMSKLAHAVATPVAELPVWPGRVA